MDATEVYVLCGSRTARVAANFLDGCLPSRTEVAEEYPFPEFADLPSMTFHSAEELMRRLETETEEEYSIYWNNSARHGPRQAMLFYTSDGAMIAGVGGPDTTWSDTIARVANRVGGRYAYVTSGSRPPETREAFIRMCREATMTNLYKGRLRGSPPH